MNGIIVLFTVWLCVPGALSTTEDDLMNHLLNFTYYNKRVRPVLQDHRPVVVKHGIILTELSEINEKQQKMILNLLQKIEWRDELLTWNPADYGGLTYLNVDLSYFWAPRLLLYNNADANYPLNHDNTDTKVVLSFDGNITWIKQVVFKSSCKINVQYFPLDEQFCVLRIGSGTYGIDKLDSYPISNHVDLSRYSANGQWELMETWADRQMLQHVCCKKEVAEIVYYFHIRRLPLFYITNFILPCALIAALTAMVFATPAETGEQLAVGVTILLSLVVFFLMVETRVPNTSDHLPLIAKYYCCTVVEISAVLAVTCIIHKFEHHSAVPLPAWVKKYIIGHLGKLVFMKFASKETNTKEIELNGGDQNENMAKKNLWAKKGQLGKILALKQESDPFANNVHLDGILENMKVDKESQELEMQWKHAANVLARFSSLVYIFIVAVTFFATLLARPKSEKVFEK